MEKKLQLLGRSVDNLSVNSELIAGHIDRKLVILDLLDLLLAGCLTDAPVNGLDSCDNLLGIERLDDIVVGTELETQNLIKGLLLCSYHNDRHIGLLSDLSADLPAVYARKHDIKQDNVRLERIEFYDSLLAVVSKNNTVTVFFKIQSQKLADILIIIDYKNSSQ